MPASDSPATFIMIRRRPNVEWSGMSMRHVIHHRAVVGHAIPGCLHNRRLRECGGAGIVHEDPGRVGGRKNDAVGIVAGPLHHANRRGAATVASIAVLSNEPAFVEEPRVLASSPARVFGLVQVAVAVEVGGGIEDGYRAADRRAVVIATAVIIPRVELAISRCRARSYHAPPDVVILIRQEFSKSSDLSGNQTRHPIGGGCERDLPGVKPLVVSVSVVIVCQDVGFPEPSTPLQYSRTANQPP